MRNELTRIRLMHVLHYDPVTGVFTWINPQSVRVKRGDEAGNVRKDGYLRIGIDGRSYMAHRLATLYMTGVMPPDDVDHKNRSRLANRWDNLRPATRQQNTCNRSMTGANSSGVVGVCWDDARGKWLSRIKIKGTTINLGRFVDFDDAVRAREIAEARYFGEFAPGASVEESI